MGKSEDDLRRVLREDAGSAEFVDLAALLVERGALLEALEACLRGVAANPGFHPGRLMLARVFYLMSLAPFAIREVATLCQELPHCVSLRRLLTKLSGGAVSPQTQSVEEGEKTLAEAEFDLDSLGELEAEDKSH